MPLNIGKENTNQVGSRQFDSKILRQNNTSYLKKDILEIRLVLCALSTLVFGLKIIWLPRINVRLIVPVTDIIERESREPNIPFIGGGLMTFQVNSINGSNYNNPASTKQHL